MTATNKQIQTFVDQRTRVRSEQIRSLLLAMKDDIAAIDDVYQTLNVSPPDPAAAWLVGTTYSKDATVTYGGLTYTSLVASNVGKVPPQEPTYWSVGVDLRPWSDSNPNGPPHLMASSDILGINALVVALASAIEGHGQYPVALKACTRPPTQ